MSISYKIGAVSKLTGISVDRLRAWERRYAAVVPKRGDRRRGYEKADIDRLILLRRAVERGHSISTVAGLPDPELRTLLGEDGTSTLNSANLIDPLLRAMEDFDYCDLRDSLARMTAVLPPASLVNQVVLPLMNLVGERWHDGSLSVAQEHMVSGLVHQLLGTLMGLYRPAPNATKLIFTTIEGEQHVLGILAAAMLAAGAGLSPIYLGASLPPKEIAFAARRSRAKVVVLQVCDSGVLVPEPLQVLRSSLPDEVELWLGGNLQFNIDGAIVLPDFAALDENYHRLTAIA
jgi:methanogenic corrinoid protein MtbC1